MKANRLVLAFCAAVVLLAPASASAYVEPGASLVSASLAAGEQADDGTSQVTLSDDGRYAFFATTARNLLAQGSTVSPQPIDSDRYAAGGLFRRLLSNGSLQLVAPGDLMARNAPGTALLRGALNASSSSDGRYVAFSTGWPLVAGDVNKAVDVYVRDMEIPIDQPGAFDLVSARDGGSDPATWATPFSDRPGRNPGADVTLGHAISDDGNRVVFKTDAVGDLPAAEPEATPKGQVLMRDRSAKSTALVATALDGGGPIGVTEFGPDPFNLARSPSISGDGTSVAWVGRNAPSQVPLLVGESLDPKQDYILFRKVSGSGAGDTRRLLTTVDPDDADCPAGFVTIPDFYVTGPCYGPLGEPEDRYGGLNAMVPSLNRDGTSALLTTNAATRNQLGQGVSADAWVVGTAPGQSRKAVSLELTRDSSQSYAGDPIEGATMSEDGRWVLLVTKRSVFSLPTLAPLGSARQEPTIAELQLVDLKERTIERILRSPQGNDTDGNVIGAPAISSDGGVIGFLSNATNLFIGDANQQTDAFTVLRTDPPDDRPPVDPEPKPLTASANPSRSGAVAFPVSLPAAGSLSIRLIGRIPASGRRPARDAVVGTAFTWVTRASNRTVTVKVAPAWRGTLKSLKRIRTKVKLRFTDLDGTPYFRDLDLVLRG
ncbi:MAG: hypothetical protein WCO96_03955 [Actinomycetes bacterium]